MTEPSRPGSQPSVKDPLDPIHDSNQSGMDQSVETIRQQTRHAPELAGAIEKRPEPSDTPTAN
jgi:hypothetical protein